MRWWLIIFAAPHRRNLFNEWDPSESDGCLWSICSCGWTHPHVSALLSTTIKPKIVEERKVNWFYIFITWLSISTHRTIKHWYGWVFGFSGSITDGFQAGGSLGFSYESRLIDVFFVWQIQLNMSWLKKHVCWEVSIHFVAFQVPASSTLITYLRWCFLFTFTFCRVPCCSMTARATFFFSKISQHFLLNQTFLQHRSTYST